MWNKQTANRRGFTLIELLVVVAIIALLIAILLPSLARARQISARSACGAQLKGIGQGLAIFAGYNDEILPWNGRAGNGGTGSSDWTGQVVLISRENWQRGPTFAAAMREYVGSSKQYNCPGLSAPWPGSLNDFTTGQPWWDEGTQSQKSGTNTRRHRVSYMIYTNDMGNYTRTGSQTNDYFVYDPTKTSSNGGAWWQDSGKTTLFEGLNLFRRKFNSLKPDQLLMMDLAVFDRVNGNFAYGNHPTTTAIGSSPPTIGTGSNATAQAGFYIATAPSQLSANYLNADGSVQNLNLGQATEIFTRNLFTVGDPPNMWSVYVNMPLSFRSID